MPRPDMLALGGPAHANPLTDWFVGCFLSLCHDSFLASARSFSLIALGVNVLVGNIYGGFLEPRAHCRGVSLANIFYARLI